MKLFLWYLAPTNWILVSDLPLKRDIIQWFFWGIAAKHEVSILFLFIVFFSSLITTFYNYLFARTLDKRKGSIYNPLLWAALLMLLISFYFLLKFLYLGKQFRRQEERYTSFRLIYEPCEKGCYRNQNGIFSFALGNSNITIQYFTMKISDVLGKIDLSFLKRKLHFTKKWSHGFSQVDNRW